jgi:biopolymer transport protein ExbB
MKLFMPVHRMATVWALLAVLAVTWIAHQPILAVADTNASSNTSLTINNSESQTEASVPPATASISTTNIRQILSDGGPVMYTIVLCSFLVVTFTLERSVNLRRSRVIPKPFVTRFMQQLQEGQLDRQQALQLCEANGSPVAQVFSGAVRKWGRPSVEVEQGVIDSGERVTNGLRRYLRIFYGTATVGPLLGLMGTVLGMIQTFNVIALADAQGRPELLAGGIAKALLNTAGGLAVAIPASILYVFFVSRVDKLVIEIDRLAQEVANSISAEELSDREKKPGSRKKAA